MLIYSLLLQNLLPIWLPNDPHLLRSHLPKRPKDTDNQITLSEAIAALEVERARTNLERAMKEAAEAKVVRLEKKVGELKEKVDVLEGRREARQGNVEPAAETVTGSEEKWVSSMPRPEHTRKMLAEFPKMLGENWLEYFNRHPEFVRDDDGNVQPTAEGGTGVGNVLGGNNNTGARHGNVQPLVPEDPRRPGETWRREYMDRRAQEHRYDVAMNNLGLNLGGARRFPTL